MTNANPSNAGREAGVRVSTDQAELDLDWLIVPLEFLAKCFEGGEMGVVGRVVDLGAPALVGKREFEHFGPGSGQGQPELIEHDRDRFESEQPDIGCVRENHLAPLALIGADVEEHGVFRRCFSSDSFDYPPFAVDVDVSFDIAPRHHIAPAEFVKRAAQCGPAAGVP